MPVLIPRIKRILFPCLVLFGVGSCTTDLGGPERPQLKAPEGPAFTEYEFLPDEVSIQDEDGTHYTLSISASEIRMSDGRVLVLTDSQLDYALEAFYGTIATDPTARDVATLPCPEPDQGGCWEPQNRVIEPKDLTASGINRRPGSMPPKVLRRGEVPKASGLERPTILVRLLGWQANETPNRGRMRSRVPNRPTTYNYVPGPQLFSFASTSYSMLNGPCEDVATDAVMRANDYFSKRTSFIKEIWPFAVAEAGNALKKYIPHGSSLQAGFLGWIAQHRESRIKVNMLAWIWNSYNCSNRVVVAGPIFLETGGGASSGGGGGIQCDYAPGSISFDGGNTWHYVTVKVCYAVT